MKTTIKVTTMVILMVISGMGITRAQDANTDTARRFNPILNCMNIPDLTDDQKEKITTLNEAHRKMMDQLRTERFEAEDIYTRNEIGAKMLLQQNEHLKKIEAQLTDTQKELFAKNTTDRGDKGRAMRGNNQRPMMRHGNRGGGRGYGKGYHRGQGRGFAPGGGRF